MNLLSSPLSFAIYAGALILAITLHEFAHAFVADHLGDPTPRLQGRLTLNPLAHLDMLGTLMLFLVHFGWGKPVQFDPFNLRNPRRDAALISLAGPVSNLVVAILSSAMLRLLPIARGVNLTPGISLLLVFLTGFLSVFVYSNVVLAIFNLIPVHPLDGFKIVGGFLSRDQAREWYSLERYGMIFLLFLLFPLFGPAPISLILTPAVNFILSLLLPGGGSFV